MELVYVGKIVNTHGIKGEIRVKSDFELKSRVFEVGKEIVIANKTYVIASYRVHKGFDMITLEGFDDINQVLPFKGKGLFIRRDYLDLGDKDYILEDLIGCDIILNDEVLGRVTDYQTGMNQLLIVNFNNKTYYIPLNGDFIKSVDASNNKIFVNEDIKGLIIWR